MTFEKQVGPQLREINSIFGLCVTDTEVNAALTKALDSIRSLEQILSSVSNTQEHSVYVQALQEIQYSLLSIATGNYRHAYSSLRLFFELFLAAVEFSTNKRYFQGWRLGKEDIFWTRLSDAENGVMSKNFCSLFFPELANEAPHFRSIATTVYRECSEFVHGNPQAISTLPITLQYKKEIPLDWADKLDSMHFVLTFVFAIRYLVDLPVETREYVKEYVLAQIGHLKPIREVLGGIVED